jgi:hypothetical protein
LYTSYINTYRKFFLRIKDVYYSENFNLAHADVCYIFSVEKPKTGEHYARPTLLIDLTQSEEALIQGFSETTRRKLRKGEKDNSLEYRFFELADSSLLNSNLAFYAGFIQRKGMQKFERLRLLTLQKNGMLAISVIKDKVSGLIIHHLYLVTPFRAELIYSVNNFENGDNELFKKMANANVLAHKNDMLEFKKRGVPIFDFGGWYHGGEDIKQMNINFFKEGFGGEVTFLYNRIEYVSALGKFVRLIKKLKSKL